MNHNSTSFRWLLLASLTLMTSLCTEANPKGTKNVLLGTSPRKGSTGKSYRQATGEAILQNGQVTGVRITNRGHYSTDTKVGVVFSGGGGSGASGKAELRLNSVGMEPATLFWLEVKGVQITNPGSGYTSPPTVTFVVQ